jgi:zinc and cadmium transporter|tara:strand:+ start:141 stop:872 length:732 start_codon:yes stop_codon:yes gene_type:complete
MITILFFSVLFTGLLTELVSKKLEKYKTIIISYSVAIVLTLLCTHILPELFSGHNHEIGYFLLTGFILQILLELLSKGIEHGHVHLHGEISNKQLMVIFIGLTLHSFIEGLPIKTFEDLDTHSISFNSTSISWVYLSAILIHKLPIAAVLMIFLNSINSSLTKKIIFLLVFAISSPAGGYFGEYLIKFDFFRDWSNNFLAISCGMLLHITTLLIFEDHHSNEKLKNIITISAGIITGLLIFSL